MTSTPSQPDQQRVVVALLNRASTNHRLTILDRLVSDVASPFQLVAEHSLRLSLPQDDELLRSLLANEIDTYGEAETLVRWALKFTAANNFFLVLKLKHPSNETHHTNICQLFIADHAPALWEAYGQDEIYVSPDCATAEMQIQLLFPDGIDNSVLDVQGSPTESSVALALQAPLMMHNMSSSSAGESAFSSTSVISTTSTTATTTTTTTATPSLRPQSRASMNSSTFKARPIPSTVKSKPLIQPRLSRAAALRMGVELPESPARSQQQSRNTSPSKVAAGGNVGISGVAKRPVAPPVSLKAPSIVPRLNKAAMARQGGGEAAVSTGRPTSAAGNSRLAFPSSTAAAGGVSDAARPRREVDFSNTPGHKRQSLVGRSSIASIAPPSIAPRQNRASMSRIQQQPGGGFVPFTVSSPRSTSAAAAPPSAYRGTALAGRTLSSAAAPRHSTGAKAGGEIVEAKQRKPISFAHTPGHKRASLSLSIPSLAAPLVAPRQNRASLARTQPPSSNAIALSSHHSNNNAAAAAKSPAQTVAGKENSPTKPDFASVPGHKRASLSFSLASLRAPSIAPRLNKAAGARIGLGGVGGGNKI